MAWHVVQLPPGKDSLFCAISKAH